MDYSALLIRLVGALSLLHAACGHDEHGTDIHDLTDIDFNRLKFKEYTTTQIPPTPRECRDRAPALFCEQRRHKWCPYSVVFAEYTCQRTCGCRPPPRDDIDRAWSEKPEQVAPDSGEAKAAVEEYPDSPESPESPETEEYEYYYESEETTIPTTRRPVPVVTEPYKGYGHGGGQSGGYVAQPQPPNQYYGPQPQPYGHRQPYVIYGNNRPYRTAYGYRGHGK